MYLRLRETKIADENIFQPHGEGGYFNDLYANPEYMYTSRGLLEVSTAITIETPPVGPDEPSAGEEPILTEIEKAKLWYKSQPKPAPANRQNPVTVDTEETTWQSYANCNGVDPELFFPERGVSTREAKQVCDSCVVRDKCLEDALINGDIHGMWGGASERKRRSLRKQLRAMRAAGEIAMAD